MQCYGGDGSSIYTRIIEHSRNECAATETEAHATCLNVFAQDTRAEVAVLTIKLAIAQNLHSNKDA